MEYPTRHKSHVTETASFKRLDACIPSDWIIRHVSERDYGIDCLIEPVAPDHQMRGDLLAIQLKGTQALTWHESDDTTGDLRTVFSGIAVQTVNYWMGLPVPVFLCIHDQASDAIHFAAVKRQVRNRYGELRSQATFGFGLQSNFDLVRPHGYVLLYALYRQERAYPEFAAALTDLLVNKDAYVEYILGNIHRDPFLEVDTAKVLTLQKLYRNLEIVADYTWTKWEIQSFESLIEKDRKLFGDEYTILHEKTHAYILTMLAPLYLETLVRGCELVTVKDRDYWKMNDVFLYRYITEEGADEWISQARHRLKYIL